MLSSRPDRRPLAPPDTPARRATTVLLVLALGLAAFVYAYRNLPQRPFAADDYQWLIGAQSLGFREMLRSAFDTGQSHFYRPLVWVLFWVQARLFGLQPQGYHAVSLALHLLNAGLAGTLVRRLTADQRPGTKDQGKKYAAFFFGLSSSVLAAAIVALHPAPFEAVVWISAQSELLAATLLLLMLHLWLLRTEDGGRRTEDADSRLASHVSRLASRVFRPSAVLATLALAAALLTKESAVIGLPLLLLLGTEGWRSGVRSRGSGAETRRGGDKERSGFDIQHSTFNISGLTFSVQRSAFSLLAFLLPALVTLAYLLIQLGVGRRNYLVEGGAYGAGPQLIMNPLRSLALLVAPLSGTEHADAAWLVPLGLVVALGLLATLFVARFQTSARLVLALGLTLLPSAPFAAPPNSRYLYLPVIAGAVLVGVLSAGRPATDDRRRRRFLPLSPSAPLPLSPFPGLLSAVARLPSFALVALLAWLAAAELAAREARFAAATGPGGSLWQTASAVCAERTPDRVIVVEPPVAAPHVEAILRLACGSTITPIIVERAAAEANLEDNAVIIGFPGGRAVVERRT